MLRTTSPVGTCVRWAARLTSLLTLAVVVLLATVPAGPPTAGEVVALALFPGGVLVGFAIGWWWDGLGGLISVASLAAFYAWMIAQAGTPPRGPYFAILTAPALLYLLSGLLNRSRPHWAG